ncbi:hypothetical protein M422DRAFT_251536 [Sphaerobolus stellatus SS14]|uniref:Uncharacterized protein n=1 Tax=Sphaerobolus stellatus (strain SS14) TaxID=990650 RepID=A0A0C9VRD2_SPHS4|nr:hypothetical protein M422DRAFT_251536 [Sphaerobolus stellatus SS14]
MIFKTYVVTRARGKDLIHLLQESDDTRQFRESFKRKLFHPSSPLFPDGKYVVEFVDFRVNKAIEAKNKRSMAQDNGNRDVDPAGEGDDDEYRDDEAKEAKKVKKKVAKKTVVNVKVAKVKVAKVDVKTAEDKDQAHGESEYKDEEEEANVQVDNKSDDKVEDEEQLGDKHEQERDDGHEQDIEQEQFLEEENEPDDKVGQDDNQEQDDGHEQDDEHEQHLGEEHELDDEVEQDKEHADDHHGPQTRRTLVLLKDQTKKLRTIVKLLQKTPGYMKYNDHGKLRFNTELQQHLDAMILVSKSFLPAGARIN